MLNKTGFYLDAYIISHWKSLFVTFYLDFFMPYIYIPSKGILSSVFNSVILLFCLGYSTNTLVPGTVPLMDSKLSKLFFSFSVRCN